MTLSRTANLVAGLMVLGGPLVAQEVRPAWNGINEELFQTYIVMEGLRELGYDVSDVNQAQVQLAHVAIANGDLDFYASHWVPLHNAFWEEAGGDERLQRVGLLAEGSLQGYLIDTKTADETGIQYLEELADPEKAALFDIDGNGKADLYGCEPGWGCERTIEHHLDAYGLRDTIEHKQGGYFAIIPDAIERIKSGQPTLYYTWTPLWVSAVLRPGEEVEWLNVQTTDLPEGDDVDTTAEGIGNLGFSINDQKIIANTDFLEENSSAKRFFELVQIPIEDINAQNLLINEGESSEEAIMGHAKAWIADHQQEWDGWIAEAKKAAS
jgi:glycine betaine/proline transport system substrate-binding protein